MPPTSCPVPYDLDEFSDYTSQHRTPPASLRTSISPPPFRRKSHKPISTQHPNQPSTIQATSASPTRAAIETGEVQITDRLSHFSTQLSNYAQSSAPLSIPTFRALYARNQHPHGRHFVIHQHDHPVAGVHYDLRLQVNETSSISWAIMYGLPGNANSRRLNRNATETRVHCVWNHLIETASDCTGSLLIWDTGEYEMLPYRETKPKDTDDEMDDVSPKAPDADSKLSDSEKLHTAFQNRKIRIRLHGARLLPGYTLSIRLAASNNRHEQPVKPSRKRKRKAPTASQPRHITPPTSDIDDDEVPVAANEEVNGSMSAMKREIAEQEDEEVRRTNAYFGATNTIGSIHQRRWFLSMDRYASGLCPAKKDGGNGGGRREWVRRWDDGRLLGFEPFFVMGREVERSVVTGRKADEVMADEGVKSFVGRKGWRAVTE